MRAAARRWLSTTRAHSTSKVEHTPTDLKKQQALIDLLRRTDGNGIVYVATVKHCDEVTRLLETEGLAVAKYQGRLAKAMPSSTG